jgi:hypothetical protein
MKIKDFIIGALAVILLFAATFATIWWATSPEVWNAGEHTAGCDMTEDCGCYENLMEGEK